MTTEQHSAPALARIPADRRLVDELYSHRLITRKARDHALEFLYPHRNWGLWVSRLLLSIGPSLVLAGIVYFFAFNWVKLPAAVKLGSVELALFGCAAAAYVYGLNRLSGRILLLSASVLVGVFWAVFGQIYQTGADAYTLFLGWSILVAGWVILSEFAALWAVWLVVTNIFLGLYWTQAVLPSSEQSMLIWSILAAFNLVALTFREVLVERGVEWLSERWTRLALVIPVLIFLLIPTAIFFADPHRADFGISVGAAFGLVTHAALFLIYRYRLPDVWALAAVFISSCVIVEVMGFRFLHDIFQDSDAVRLLFSGLMTIAIFTLAVSTLRHLVRHMETSNAQ
jgi:uncharacterized membrane protein